MPFLDNFFNMDSGVENNQGKIFTECVRIVYQRRSHNLLSHLVVSLLPLYIGWANEAMVMNLFLISLLWIYTFSGYYFTPSLSSSLPQDNIAKRWANALYYQLAILGILYNLIFLNLTFHGVENAMIYLLLTSALYSSGAVYSGPRKLDSSLRYNARIRGHTT